MQERDAGELGSCCNSNPRAGAGPTEDNDKMTEQFEDRVDGLEVQGHPSLMALVRILARAVARQQAREAAQAEGAEALREDTFLPIPPAQIEDDSAGLRDDDMT